MALGDSLSGTSSLRELQIPSGGLGSDGVIALGKAQNLETLSLIGNEAGEDGIIGLAGVISSGGLLDLISLDLCVNQVTVSAGVSLLKAIASRSLKVLELGGNPELVDADEFEQAVKALLVLNADIDVVWKKSQGSDAFDGQ